MNVAFTVALLACLIPLVLQLLDHLLTPQFSILNEGIVLITGASTGIGSHAAFYLANNTNYVVLAGVRKDADMENVNNLKMSNLIPIKIDVAVHDSVVSAVNEVKAHMKSKNLPFRIQENLKRHVREYPLESLLESESNQREM